MPQQKSPSNSIEVSIHPHRMHHPSASNAPSIRNENIIVSTPSFPLLCQLNQSKVVAFGKKKKKFFCFALTYSYLCMQK